jgi:hypothetical protein
MKLILCYTYFNGFDQLLESIEQMRPIVDQIIITYQKTSNKGNQSTTIMTEISVISEIYPEIIFNEFFPLKNTNTKQNERLKHDMMIESARQQNATHFILSACDHVYSPEHLEFAKNDVIQNDLDLTFTKMITYYKNKNWIIFPLENYYMPFIHKMKPETKICEAQYPVLVDPSVKVNTATKWKIYKPNQCVLHHYSMIRVDIENKFRNAAASIRWTESQIQNFINEYNSAKPGDKISYFQNHELIDISEKDFNNLF